MARNNNDTDLLEDNDDVEESKGPGEAAQTIVDDRRTENENFALMLAGSGSTANPGLQAAAQTLRASPVDQIDPVPT